MQGGFSLTDFFLEESTIYYTWLIFTGFYLYLIINMPLFCNSIMSFTPWNFLSIAASAILLTDHLSPKEHDTKKTLDESDGDFCSYPKAAFNS